MSRSHPLTCVRVCMFRHLTQHARAGLGVCSSTQLLSRRSWRPLARAGEAVQDRRDCLKVCIKMYFRHCMRLLELFVSTSVSTPHFYLHTAHLPILTNWPSAYSVSASWLCAARSSTKWLMKYLWSVGWLMRAPNRTGGNPGDIY